MIENGLIRWAVAINARMRNARRIALPAILNSIVLNASLDLEIATVGPFPKAFESSHTKSFKNIATTTDTALAFQQAQFITIPPKMTLFFFSFNWLVSGKA